LHDLAIRESARVIAIERDESSFIPDSTTMIRRGDIATLIGDVKTFDQVRRLFHTHDDRRKRIMIMGGTPLAVWLCRQLHSRAFSLRLFEPDAPRAEELSAKLDWVTVLRVDPLDTDTLTLERIDQADSFVALTDDDENNILAAARAKSMGAKEVIAVLQRGTYLHLLEHVGIDRAFSPRVAAVAEIQRLVGDQSIRHLASLTVGIVDVYEIHVPPAAKRVIGTALHDLKLPEKTIIAAIQRGDEVSVPGRDDVIQVGDTVVVVTPANGKKELMRYFAVG
jgi:trk system potassium uptake protein TrkA